MINLATFEKVLFAWLWVRLLKFGYRQVEKEQSSIEPGWQVAAEFQFDDTYIVSDLMTDVCNCDVQWLDITSDVLFLIDGIIFTNTALKSYQDPAGNSTGKEEAVLIKDRWRIVSYYLAYIFPKMILPSIVR